MTVSFRTPKDDYWQKTLRELLWSRKITIGALIAYILGCTLHMLLYGGFSLMGGAMDAVVFVYCFARIFIPIYGARIEINKIGDVPMKCDVTATTLDTTVLLGAVPLEYTKKLSQLTAGERGGYVVITGSDRFYLRIPFSAFEDDAQYDFIDAING